MNATKGVLENFAIYVNNLINKLQNHYTLAILTADLIMMMEVCYGEFFQR